MKLKVFSVQTGNRKPRFAALEDEVNAWLADHPQVVVSHTNDLSHPNVAWSHLSVAVWYDEN